MSVTLPVFQSTPTLEQMKNIDYFDNKESQTEGLISEAANNNIFVARTVDYQGYVDILRGNYSSQAAFNYCYILYVKTNISITRWVYSQDVSESVRAYLPWQAKVIEYNGVRYAVATPFFFSSSGNFTVTGCWANCPVYSTLEDFFTTEQPIPYTGTAYPITYSSSNSTVSGPSSAAVGETVEVSAVPDVGYGITDASTQILVTNNDVAVPYTWDAMNNRITFTMPDPS